MVKHQNLLLFITILFLAAVILFAKIQKHSNITSKHYALAPIGAGITLAYGPHVNGGANLLDLYLPEHSAFSSAVNKEPFPLIIFIHGGGWQSGDKEMTPDPNQFTRRGYALASINYRLTEDAMHPAQIEDCKAALTWLRTHAKTFKIDPDRIGVWGISSGGHLAALLGTTCSITSPEWTAPKGIPCSVQAVCDWCGPADLTTMAKQSGSHYVLAEPVKLFLGGTPEERAGLAREASPTTYARKGLPPFLIMHGDRDHIVPVEQSRELAKALKDNHVSVNLQIIPGAQHMFGNPAAVANVFHFFDQILKKP